MSAAPRYGEQRARLAADRMARLDRHRAARTTTEDLPVATPVGPGGTPATPAQQWAWLLDRAGHADRAWVAGTVALPGPADRTALDRAWRAVAARHEALRTSLSVTDGVLTQTVGPDPAGLWTLTVAGDDDGRVVLRAPRTVADEESVRLVAEDLRAAYDAVRAGADPAASPSSTGYRDVAGWQWDLLDRPAGQRQLAYWRSVLADPPAPVTLPVEGAHRSGGGPDRPGAAPAGRLEVPVPADVLREVHEFARRDGCGAIDVLLAAALVLLARFTGEHDLLVDLPVAGRARPDLAGVVGPLRVVLPVRVRLEPESTFGAVVRRCRQTLLDAAGRQEVPIDALAGRVRPGSGVWSPVAFLVTDGPAAPAVDGPPGGVLTVRVGPDTTALVRPEGSTVAVDDLGAALAVLLAAAVGHPDTRWPDLPLTPPGHRIRPLGLDTVPVRPDGVLHQPIVAGAARHPDRVALIAGSRTVTYGELDAATERLARRLRHHGIGPGALVAVAVERSVEMVVALLGVLRSGAAYVPVDPAQPAARQAALLDATRPAAVLCAGAVVPYAGLVLDVLGTGPEATGPLAPVDRGSPAYVVHTSGSTGAPKGVVCPHRAAANHLAFLAGAHGITADDVVLQIAPFTFDASVRDLFGPLSVGARVVLLPPERATDPASMLDLVAEHRVTCLLSVVPTLLRGMVQLAERPEPTVRLVLCSGERLYGADVTAARDLFGPDVVVVNQYGPTECAMTTTYLRVRPGDEVDAVLSVGVPVAGARVQVLDRRGRPVPVGAVGEIHLSGIGLAQGYLDAPGLTADRFVPDPSSPEPGGRMYRTGDLGRIGPDGGLVFLGRTDEQVKIRGVRVEPGEVESVLAGHPAVGQVAVVAGGEPIRLVAYVAGGADPAGLRAYARERLPDHLVPADVVVRDALPRTSTGKIDRRALRAALPAAPRPGEPSADAGHWVADLAARVRGTGVEGDR